MRDAEVVLLRLVRDGYKVRSEGEKLKLGRYRGKPDPKPLGSALRESVTKHKSEIMDLLEDPGPEAAVAEWTRATTRVANACPPYSEIDLSPARYAFKEAAQAYQDGDIAMWRYKLNRGEALGIYLSDEAQRQHEEKRWSQERLG